MADFFASNSQFDNLQDVRATQQRNAAEKKEVERYERAIASDQGKMRTVRRMILNHPTWLNRLLFHNGQWNALHLASAEGQVPKVMWLLAQEGIEVNHPDKHNFTALELSMARNYDTRVAQALLKAGAFIDTINARSLRPVFKDLIEAEKARRRPPLLRTESSKSEILRLKLYLTRVGAFKLLPLLIKNGIDNVEKFQKTSPEYLNTLGVDNGQIYQAKLKKALVTLLPALAFAQAASPKYKNKTSKATNTKATASDTGTALKGNSADSPAQNNQSTKSSTNAAPSDSIKAQTELKLFILSANLPLQFANLMFEAGVRGVQELRSIVANKDKLEGLCGQINMRPAHVRLLKAALGQPASPTP